MTREEAILCLKGIKNLGHDMFTEQKDFQECLDMAIKALEPSEDCVSRQAVLEKINDWWGITATSGEPTLCDCIRELPSVTPTRKKGKWILHEKSIPTGFKDLRECSCCKCYFDWLMPRNSYCPNCGAEMESE